MATEEHEYTRVPPFSEEAEIGIIGSILVDPKAMRTCLEKELTPDDFYTPAHRLIYETACKIQAKRRIPDILTVTEGLQQAGKLEHAGGTVFMEGLIDRTPTSAHAEYYIDIVIHKARLRQIISLCRDTELAAFSASDVESFLSKVKFDFHKVQLNSHDRVSVSELIEELIARYTGATKTGKSLGITSRWFDYQNLIVGYKPGKISIIAGATGQGKTTAGVNECLYLALTGVPVLIVSLEMEKEEIIERAIGDLMGLNMEEFAKGNATQEDIQNFALGGRIIENIPFYVEDGNHTPEQIAALVREYKEKHGIQLCMVDYIQIALTSPTVKSGNRNQELTFASQMMLHVGKETKVHMMIISQLSRSWSYKDNKEPQLNHLRDSGSLEQDAYMVTFVYLHPDQKEEWDDNQPTVFKVAKKRGGKKGRVSMTFQKTRQRFVGNDDLALVMKDFMHWLKVEIEQPAKKEDPF